MQMAYALFVVALGTLVAAIALFLRLHPRSHAAVSRMSLEERRFLVDRLMRLEAGMNEAAVSAILGPVYRLSGTPRPCWLGPDRNARSQIAVYFRNGRIRKVRWMRMWGFMYEFDPSWKPIVSPAAFSGTGWDRPSEDR
ncbi:MAG: hypothetical protein HZA54_19970 [Planctomycetes bacterium]|nr:hypothetical protein [Planctomycetota bacterium]